MTNLNIDNNANNNNIDKEEAFFLSGLEASKKLGCPQNFLNNARKSFEKRKLSPSKKQQRETLELAKAVAVVFDKQFGKQLEALALQKQQRIEAKAKKDKTLAEQTRLLKTAISNLDELYSKLNRCSEDKIPSLLKKINKEQSFVNYLTYLVSK